MFIRIATGATMFAFLFAGFPSAVRAQFQPPFLPPETLVLGSGYGEIQVGDVNNDGFSDMVVGADPRIGSATIPLAAIRVLLGGPSGMTMVDPGLLGVSSIALGDMNGDGFLDLISSGLIGPAQGISIHPGNGTGSFGTRIFETTSGNPSSFAVGDLNGNSIPDLVYIFGPTGALAIRFDDGSTQMLTPGLTDIRAIDIVQLDEPTIVIANPSGHRLLTLGGASTDVPGGSVTSRRLLAVSDVTGAQQSRVVPFTLFPPAGAPIDLTPGPGNPFAILMTELLGSSPGQEIVLTSDEEVRILPAPYTTGFAVHTGARDTAVGDFNGDGLRDLAMLTANAVTWRLQGVPPVISAGPDQTHVANNFGQAAITLSGTSSQVPQSVEWHEGTTLIGTTLTLQHTALIGERTYTLTVNTPGFSVTDTVRVSIELPGSPAGPSGPAGPAGPPGPPGPAASEAVSGSVLLLISGTPPPAGYVYLGTFKQTLPRGSGPATSVTLDVYQKP